jgi:hypothetical protein
VNTAVGIRHADYVASSPQKSALTSPTSDGISVGILRSWTKDHGVCGFVCYCKYLLWKNHYYIIATYNRIYGVKTVSLFAVHAFRYLCEAAGETACVSRERRTAETLPVTTHSRDVPLNCAIVRPGAVGDILSLSAAHNPCVTGTHSPLHIEYSPCPVRTTKSLVALRRRLTDVFAQSSQSVGTLHPPPQWSHSNPIYFALAQDRGPPYPISSNADRNPDSNISGLVKSPDGQCADGVPLKLRKKDPSLCSTENMNGTHRDKANRHANLEDRSGPKESLCNRLPLSPLSRNMASLRLSSGPKDTSLMQPATRITPPSPFVNSITFASINQTQGIQVHHDVTDPRFLSVYSMLDSADVALKISEPETMRSAELSRIQESPHTPIARGPVNRVLCYPEDSPVKRTDTSQEVDRERTKRHSLRRVRTVTSNGEEGPPVKLQPLVSSNGQLIGPAYRTEQTSGQRDTPYSRSSPITRTGCSTDVDRTRKILTQSSKLIRGKDKDTTVKDVGGGVIAVHKVASHSTCRDKASPRPDLYPAEESMLRRQGGFRRRQRKVFRSSATSDSCLLNIPDRMRDNLPGLTLPNGIPSPMSPEDSSSWWLRNHVSVSDDSKCCDTPCHLVGLPKANALHTSSHQDIFRPTSSIIERLNDRLSCLGMPRQFGISLSEGVPSPPSLTTCDDDQYCSSVGIAGIQPLSTSSVPPADSSSVVACRQKKGTADENCSPTSDDTWDSHNHQLMKAPRVSDRCLLKGATPEKGDRHLDFSSGKGALNLCSTL